MAGSPWVLPKEPQGSAVVWNQHSEGSPHGRGSPGRCVSVPGGCYLFMSRVSPHTCARIPAARRNLSLAATRRGAEGPSGPRTRAMSTGVAGVGLQGAANSAPFLETAKGWGPGRTRLWPHLLDSKISLFWRWVSALDPAASSGSGSRRPPVLRSARNPSEAKVGTGPWTPPSSSSPRKRHLHLGLKKKTER